MRFRIAFITLGFTLTMLVGGYALGVYDDIRWAKYEADVARYEREVQREAETAAEDVADAAEQSVKDAESAAPTEVTAAAPATSSATPAASPTAKPETATAAFLKAWSAGGTAASDKAWIDTMRPYVTPSMLASFELTDHTAMPKGLKATNLSTVESDETAVTLANVGEFGQIKVTAALVDGKWLVNSLVPSDGH